MTRLLLRTLLILIFSTTMTGCLSLRVGGDDRDDAAVEMGGVVNGYADTVEWDAHDEYGIDVLRFRRGEVASVDVGPIFGVGVGLAGFRLRIWPFDIGLGTLAYHPEPERAPDRDEDDESGDRRVDLESDSKSGDQDG